MVFHKWFLFVAVIWAIAILLPSAIDAACVCNEKGTDYCAGCSGRRVVRPKQRQKSDDNVDLSPIGDKCWCTKKMIEPAVLPKPLRPSPKSKSCGCRKSSHSDDSSSHYSASHDSSSHDSSSYDSSSYDSPSYDPLPSIFSSSSSSSSSSGSSYLSSHDNYVKTVSKDDSLPADPISVSMAIQAGKAIEVPEAKLSYGYVQKPINSLPKLYISSVKEENLYALKNDVITLKKKNSMHHGVKKSEDYDTEIEDYDVNSGGYGNGDDDGNDDEKPQLTYRQLGYVAEQYKNPKFQEVSSSSSHESRSKYNGGERAVIRGKFSVDCGYKPGRIAPLRKHRHCGDRDNC